MLADLVLVVLLAGAFALGFMQGVIRQLLSLGAWLVAFVLAANLRGGLGAWLSGHWTEFSLAYNEMLAFAIVFLAVLVPALVVIQLGGRTVDLTRHAVFDDVLAGLVGLALGILVISSVMVILDTFYAAPPTGPLRDVAFLRQLQLGLADSAIADGLRSSLIPGLAAVLGPLLPTGVSSVMR